MVIINNIYIYYYISTTLPTTYVDRILCQNNRRVLILAKMRLTAKTPLLGGKVPILTESPFFLVIHPAQSSPTPVKL